MDQECEGGCNGTGTIETENGHFDCVCELERKAEDAIDIELGK